MISIANYFSIQMNDCQCTITHSDYKNEEFRTLFLIMTWKLLSSYIHRSHWATFLNFIFLPFCFYCIMFSKLSNFFVPSPISSSSVLLISTLIYARFHIRTLLEFVFPFFSLFLLIIPIEIRSLIFALFPFFILLSI